MDSKQHLLNFLIGTHYLPGGKYIEGKKQEESSVAVWLDLCWCQFILNRHHVVSFSFIFFKNRPISASFISFRIPIQMKKYNLNYINWKNVDGVHGIRTRGRRMLGTDNSTKLWRPPIPFIFCLFPTNKTTTFYNKLLRTMRSDDLLNTSLLPAPITARPGLTVAVTITVWLVSSLTGLDSVSSFATYLQISTDRLVW